jgi:pseudaminic acid synthase
MTQSFVINQKKIGPLYKPYVIAELSCNHNGEFERALKIIDTAYEVGADAIKLQTYTPDCLTLDCNKPDFLIQTGLWKGYTLHRLYQEGTTPFEWHEKLFAYAQSKGLTIFSSPFSFKAIELLEKLNTPAYKIASFEIVDLDLIKKAASTGKPLIISTGLSDRQTVQEAVDAALSTGNKSIALLHCVSGYPNPLTASNLSNITRLKTFFPKCIIGLSDHSSGYEMPFLSIGLGARIIEKHLTLSRSDGGLDSAFSMEPHEFKDMVQKVNLAFDALGNQEKEDLQRSGSEEAYRYSLRSIYIAKPLKKGEIFTKDHLRVIRPGFGMQPKYYHSVIGKKASYDLERGVPLKWEHVEGEKDGIAKKAS